MGKAEMPVDAGMGVWYNVSNSTMLDWSVVGPHLPPAPSPKFWERGCPEQSGGWGEGHLRRNLTMSRVGCR